MLKKWALCALIVIHGLVFCESQTQPDVTLVGPVGNFSLLKFIPLWIDHLSDKLQINVLPISRTNLDGCSPAVVTAVQKGCPQFGKIAILMDNVDAYSQVPQESTIKIAISAFEATKLPKQWVDILNQHFDAVVVTDSWLIDVYSSSGVSIPIFALSPALSFDELYKTPEQSRPHTPFTFGMTGAYWDRKNHERVLHAFAKEFGSSPQVRLRLHGRGGEAELIQSLRNYVNEHNLTNVEILCDLLDSGAYATFLQSLDAYVLVSKAEGYSISPREAMALGIPCILSCNTAHIPLCESEFVRSVTSNIPIHPPRYATDDGVMYDCSEEDVRQALKDVYEHYDMYRAKAQTAKKWVQKYTFAELLPLYLTLVKPEKVCLGTTNTLERGCLTTTSPHLYKKYRQITEGQE